MKLAELEHYFARAATSGLGPIEGLERVFVSRAGLDAGARIAIYNRAYYHRLLGALVSVFERTRDVLGAAEFERHGLAYLASNPSDHPAVERVGRNFSDYLRATDPLLADLASLEWARLRALLAPDPERVASVTEAQHAEFPRARLRFVPSLERLVLDPRALKLFAGLEPEPGPACTVAASRVNHIVLHESLPATDGEALGAALAGASMTTVCALFDDGDESAAARRAASVIAGWFQRGWVERLQISGP